MRRRRSDPAGRPRRVTVLNQFYPPDGSPTAHLAAGLAGHLAARGDEVTVVAGRARYEAAGAHDRVGAGGDDGVRVIPLWVPGLGKASIARRLVGYVSFLGGATVRLLALPRQDVVVSLTTPPYVVVAALVHKLVHRRTRVVLWSMDCYPEVIEALGSRTGGDGPGPRRSIPVRVLRRVASLRRGAPLSGALRAVNRAAYRHLDHVVALDGAMRDLLVEAYAAAGRPPVTVVPNWEPAAAFPAPAAGGGPAPGSWPDGGDAELDAELAGRFVVLYLGNLGYGHPVDTVLDALDHLDEADDGTGPDGRPAAAWLFVGDGVRWPELARRAAGRGVARHVVQRGYVPKAETPALLAGAGCALVLLADEARGLMSPSKLHAALAAGRPVVYVGPEGTNVDEAIAAFGCGVSLRPGDAAGLAAAVTRLREDGAWRAELSARARRAFEEAYSDRAVLPRWDAVLDAGVPERGSPPRR